MAVTGPRWHRREATGVERLGVHRVTVPLEWARERTPVAGLGERVEHRPSFVLWWDTIWPLLVSVY